MPKPLFDRIQAALAPRARAATVLELIGVVENEIDVATAESAQHHAIAVAVGSDDATADAAADAEAKTNRRITRLTGQLAELNARHEALQEAERERERERERREVLAERDQLARDLSERWDTLALEMVSLIERIKANDERCKPFVITSAEAEARGLVGNFNYPNSGGTYAHRFTECVIPRCSNEAHSPLHWPRPRDFVAGAFG